MNSATDALIQIEGMTKVFYTDEIETHGLSAFGDLALPPDFKSLAYVNPEAPKGGLLALLVSTTGGNQNFETKYLAFQLLRPTDGTLRPSKISPAIGWVLDSVTTYTAYFHTDGSPLNTNNTASPFTICLRGNQNSTAFSFVWSAYNELGIFYDRDTVRDVPNTVTGAPTDADSVSATAQPNSCLYTATVKDYHVSNTLPASRIVRFTLVSKTTGITFSAAPNAPASWTSRISSAGDSVIYTADSTMAGIPGGIVNSDFSFVVSGPTTTPFNIGWETDQGSPLTQKFTTLTTGTLNLSCTPAVPATDSVTVSLTTNCTYKVTLKNAHNIKTPSNLVELTLSIPSGSGQITGLLSTANWNISNVSPTLVKFDGDQANSMTTGDAQDLTFSFAPQTPGSPVNLTWATFDAAAVSANAPLYTGTVPITCTPSVTICDTLTYDATTFGDTLCVNKLTLHNRKLTDIMSMVITPTNGWKIDTASTPNGWTKQIDGSQASVTYLNANGFKGGEQDEFDMRFFAYHDASAPNPDVFAIVAVTTDRVGATCQSVDTINGCLSHINPKGSVQMHSEDVGISNFAIRPNPTQGQADISFDINTQERVVITVLDILGHQMATLNSKMLSEGSYTIPYTMSGLPDGTYYVRVQTPLGIVTKKLILTK